MSTFVPLMTQVVRRELAAQRGIGLGVVDAARTNDGGGGEHHVECDVRLHGSGLVLQSVPVAVARPGISAVPRPGDLVVVGFVDGDVNGAVVLGALHAAGTPSPDAGPEEVVYAVPDSGGERRLEVQLPNGSTLTLTDSALTVTMGSTTLTVEQDGAIALEAAGDITLKANGSLSLEAATSATLTGASVTVEGSGSATLKGATTTIAGTTQFSAG
ncbi:phage baseplate assembly protein V [Jannaschia sp. R86511]|uniref:phage baseplate assembly protein V n=1 Tax=Jannaschia sp. R86511 TaxID=3093853 RepID=UPI0036D42E28